MKCPRCGTDNAGENAYCVRCGAKLDAAVYCPACGEANQADFSYCMKCGAALPSAAGAGKPAEPAPATAPAPAAPAPAPTIIIQQEQKKRPAWALPLLVTGLLLTLICLVLVKSGVVDLPPIPFLEGILPDKPGAVADIPAEDPKQEPGIAPEDDAEFDPDRICNAFTWDVISVTEPRLENGQGVDGLAVYAWPQEIIYGGMIMAGQERGKYLIMHREDESKETYSLQMNVLMNFEGDIAIDLRQCRVIASGDQASRIECPLYAPSTAGRWRYHLYMFAGREADGGHIGCQQGYGGIREGTSLEFDIEPAEEVCYSAEPYSFDAAKVNYWFTQTPTTDLHLSIINDQPFRHSGYTVWMAQPPAAPKISAECKVSATDPNRVDCTFPEFAGPSATWTVMMEHNGCVFFEKEVWVAMPLCPAGETYHEGHPYNNGCCTDGCWCELPTWGWGCWESCAAHCAN